MAAQTDKLLAELTRLYLAPEGMTRDVLAQHVLGQHTRAAKLTTANGLVRALAIPFRKAAGVDADRHWTRLCEVANALQAELGLPAPAVSIDGASAFYLWLSLESPVPAAQAQDFLELLRLAYAPEIEFAPDAATAPVYLPPCLNPRSGKWAAFIHPGMGASFADESGLDMAPPLAGQAGFLEGLDSIAEAQFAQALRKLQQPGAAIKETAAPLADAREAEASGKIVQAASAPDGLLLKDATLEDIVRFLQAQHIEPTFRFLTPR